MGIARLLAGLLLFCSFAAEGKARPGPSEDAEIRAMMESTVRVQVHITATVKTDEQEADIEADSLGSGVVYEKSGGESSPMTSKILTANHVLGAYKQGQVIVLPAGTLTIKTIGFKVLTHDGRTCNLHILKLGPDQELHDVATGEADCDAGRVAKLASKVPVAGAKIFIVGHPLGIEHTIVTEGYVCGWAFEGYLLASAPSTHGNSGGPVFYHGEVVGLLVRGADDFSNISLVVPLKSVLERVAGN